MPSVLSKSLHWIMMSDWRFRWNCYEVVHTWTPSCSESALMIFEDVFTEGFKMYALLYIASHVFFTKDKWKLITYEGIDGWKQAMNSAFTSSCFLGMNAFAMLGGFCLVRHMSGAFWLITESTIPAIIGSLLAIQIEKPSRVSALAIYVANIASECLFNIYCDRGYIKPFPKGDVMLFTFSMSVLLYLVKKKGYGHDPVSLVLRFLLGSAEAKKKEPSPSKLEISNDSSNMLKMSDLKPTTFWNNRHDSCKHPQSCFEYVIEGFSKPFLIGYCGQLALLTAINFRNIIKTPLSFKNLMFSPKTTQFGLFLGSFSGIFKMVNCLLRHYTGKEHEWHSALAAAAAGPSMMFSPNATVTMYLTWKMIETVYYTGVNNGYFKRPLHTMMMVYAMSVAIIFYTGLLEPSHLRPSYFKFIDRITKHKLHLINRNLLDVFQTGASIGYEEYFADLNIPWCSSTFMETVFIWGTF